METQVRERRSLSGWWGVGKGGGPGVGAGGALHGQGLQESGAAKRGGGDSRGAWRRSDRGSSPRAGGGRHLEGWGGPCPFLAAHNQASPLQAGPPGKGGGPA